MNTIKKEITDIKKTMAKERGWYQRTINLLSKVKDSDIPEGLELSCGQNIFVTVRSFDNLHIGRVFMRSLCPGWNGTISTLYHYTHMCECTYRDDSHNYLYLKVEFKEEDTPADLTKDGKCGWKDSLVPGSVNRSWACDI